MAGKKVVPRNKKAAIPRQADPAVPKYRVLAQSGNYFMVDRASVTDPKTGLIDQAKIRAVAATDKWRFLLTKDLSTGKVGFSRSYITKDVSDYLEPKTFLTNMGISSKEFELFDTIDPSSKASSIKKKTSDKPFKHTKKVVQTTIRRSDNAIVRQEKMLASKAPDGSTQLRPVREKKRVIPREPKANKAKNVAEKKTERGNRQMVALGKTLRGAKKMTPAQKKQSEVANKRVVKKSKTTKKKVIKKAPRAKSLLGKKFYITKSEQLDRRVKPPKLRPSQYIDAKGVVRSSSIARAKKYRAGGGMMTRAVQRKARAEITARLKAEKAALSKKLFDEHLKFSNARKTARQSFINDRRRLQRAIGKAARMAPIKRIMSSVSSGYRSKAPLGMLMKGQLDTRLTRQAIRQAPRSVRYPAMQHAAHNRPAGAIAAALKPMGGGLRLDAAGVARPHTSFGSLNAMFRGFDTPMQGMVPFEHPLGPRGVSVHIDAERVIQNLSVNFPAAIKRALVANADRIGRKMLDIIEPYVPKDTGLLYSTATSLARMNADGSVSINGAMAYSGAEMYGVTVSYNAPYAELVYNDTSKLHGAAYNAKYGGSQKGEKETAEWIKVAMREEQAAFRSLFMEYSRAIDNAVSAAAR